MWLLHRISRDPANAALRYPPCLQDPDLERLREQKVFDSVVSSVKGGLSEGAFIKARAEAKVRLKALDSAASCGLKRTNGISFSMLKQLMRICPSSLPSQSPFRLFRTIVLGGLSAGAAVGLIIIIGRLVASLKGATP